MKRLQLTTEHVGAFKMGINLVKENGILFMYKGLDAGIVRQLTYGTARLGIFRYLTDNYSPKDGSGMTIWGRLGCSVVAGGLGALIGTPPDSALVRMQGDTMLPKDQRRNYRHVGDALMRMIREEGLKGFFSGATPTIARGLAINIGMLTTYDGIKDSLKSYMPETANRFVSGFLSGWIAATVALPFDFIKTRM